MSRTGEPGYRADLEGLRGVAVLLVLLCHVGVPGAEAGFVGVDVFFVLSGFLITGLLLNEHRLTGRISLGAFYARRARRILPAAVLVLATTLVAAELVLSPLDLRRIADDGLAASLSLANVRFAVDATDYFSPVDASPMLHFWSLAVEEQFYMLWPIMLLAVARIGRPRLAMATLVAIVLAGSFTLCAAITDSSDAWAYYSLPTRVWQLAAGALLALGATRFGRAPNSVAVVTGWLGAAMLGASLVVIGPTTPYPGLVSLLPTLAAAALIASGGIIGSPGWMVLARRPMRWLGRISYSLYLWHWPILVIGPAALGLGGIDGTPSADDLVQRLGLAGVAVVLATATWALVEEPFRSGRLVPHGRVRGLALAGSAAIALVLGSTAIGVIGDGEVSAAASTDQPDNAALLAGPSDVDPAQTAIQPQTPDMGPIPPPPVTQPATTGPHRCASHAATGRPDRRSAASRPHAITCSGAS